MMLGTLNFMFVASKAGKFPALFFLLAGPQYELLQEKKRVMEIGKSNIYMQTDVQSTSPSSANTGRNTEFLFCS